MSYYKDWRNNMPIVSALFLVLFKPLWNLYFPFNFVKLFLKILLVSVVDVLLSY